MRPGAIRQSAPRQVSIAPTPRARAVLARQGRARRAPTRRSPGSAASPHRPRASTRLRSRPVAPVPRSLCRQPPRESGDLAAVHAAGEADLAACRRSLRRGHPRPRWGRPRRCRCCGSSRRRCRARGLAPRRRSDRRFGDSACSRSCQLRRACSKLTVGQRPRSAVGGEAVGTPRHLTRDVDRVRLRRGAPSG